MSIAVDTNRYSEFVQGKPDAVAVFSNAEMIYLPVVVLGELRAGFARGSKQAENEVILRQFLARPDVKILIADEPTSAIYGALEAELRARGKPIPTNDVWIAALTLQHGLTLFTRDPHFQHLPQVPVV